LITGHFNREHGKYGYREPLILRLPWRVQGASPASCRKCTVRIRREDMRKYSRDIDITGGQPETLKRLPPKEMLSPDCAFKV
jgi:hypothetical protein